MCNVTVRALALKFMAASKNADVNKEYEWLDEAAKAFAASLGKQEGTYFTWELEQEAIKLGVPA